MYKIRDQSATKREYTNSLSELFLVDAHKRQFDEPPEDVVVEKSDQHIKEGSQDLSPPAIVSE